MFAPTFTPNRYILLMNIFIFGTFIFGTSAYIMLAKHDLNYNSIIIDLHDSKLNYHENSTSYLPPNAHAI